MAERGKTIIVFMIFSPVIPGRSIGAVSVGLPRAEIRRLFDDSPFVVPRTEYTRGETDYFRKSGIQAHYNSVEVCEAVTALKEASPSLNGQPLCGDSIDAYLEWIKEKDPGFERVEEGVICRGIGMALFVPAMDDMDERDRKISAVHVFMDGYYELHGM